MLMANALGSRIKAERRACGLTQRELAGEDYSPTFISKIESGTVSPSLDTLEKLAARLGRPVSYFLEGVDVAARLKARVVGLSLELGETNLHNRTFAQAQDYFQQALALAQEMEDTALVARAHLGLARMCLEDEQSDTAEQHLIAAQTHYATSEDAYQCALLHNAWGNLYFERRRYRQAQECYEQALKLIKGQREFLDLEGRVLYNLADTCRVLEDLKSSTRYYHQALELLADTDDFYKQAVIYMSLSLNYRDRGNLDQAVEYAERSKGLFIAVDNLKLAGQVNTNLGLIYLDKGEVDQALEYLQESATISQQLKDAQGEMGAYYALAKYFYKVGEHEHALEYAHKVLGLESRVERSGQPAYAEAIIGRIGCRRGNRDEGIARLLKAAQALEKMGSEEEAGKIYAEVGKAYTELGDLVQANEHFMRQVVLIEKKEAFP
jgi:tetratricopeptide (TPR) repeat protein